MQIVATVLAAGKQAIVLVPEIGLTPQIVVRFQLRFPQMVTALHSGLTDRERSEAWLKGKFRASKNYHRHTLSNFYPPK